SLLNSLSLDGQGLAGNRGSIELKYQEKNHYRVKLQRAWGDLQETAEKRQAVARIVLDTIARKIPSASSGEHLVKFSESELLEALHADMFIAAQIRDFSAVIERALLFLHEQKAIILQQGLAVFRSAMTITILPGAKGRRFTNGDYSSLKEHYLERNFQIHVMNRYADLGLQKIKSALTLVAAYFTMSKTEFVKMFFAGEQDMLDRATSAESYQEIVDQLNNGVQIAVVSARPHSNMLVLAGPGSGKTRVIAHRCAFLLRVERIRASEILVVCFNRAAAVSLRQRIRDLAGKDAARVTVQTYHGLAMRLIGASFSAHLDDKGEMLDLESMIPAATRMLRGECDIPGVERDEMRERLLAGYRHILIDEYQDIDQPQYDMVSAIAGRALDSENEDAKLSILAVGDDDQNVYTFRGANIQFIRQFEQDYNARTHYLVENYRSTANIINAANQLIELNSDRMKTGHPIQINAARRSEPCGDPVRIVACPDPLQQARFVLNEVKECRNAGGGIAVFSRTKSELHAIRAALETAAIPSIMASQGRGNTPLHRMREINALIDCTRQLQQSTVTATRLQNEFQGLECYAEANPWCRLMDGILREWEDETNNSGRTPCEAIDYLYEALHERQSEQLSDDEVYLSTVHAAKGLEFEHVIMLGRWDKHGSVLQQEEERRLYYVGMTRARRTLTLCQLDHATNPHTDVLAGSGIVRSKAGMLNEPSDQDLRLHYAMLDLSCIWISYPATAPNARFVQQEIARLTQGSCLHLERGGNNNRVFITDKGGHKIGALSNAASLEWKDRLRLIKEVRVHAIMNWRRDFLDHTPGDEYPKEWEVPLL
ncbi:MAG TPA: RecQ family ATP-dependent DNA helicase, partial [Gammaproteobacteria bacterium]|nr:RecQ family ATP-dependent DNA helicase [Gammaproteobacteria bacterium]